MRGRPDVRARPASLHGQATRSPGYPGASFVGTQRKRLAWEYRARQVVRSHTIQPMTTPPAYTGPAPPSVRWGGADNDRLWQQAGPTGRVAADSCGRGRGAAGSGGDVDPGGVGGPGWRTDMDLPAAGSRLRGVVAAPPLGVLAPWDRARTGAGIGRQDGRRRCGNPAGREPRWGVVRLTARVWSHCPRVVSIVDASYSTAALFTRPVHPNRSAAATASRATASSATSPTNDTAPIPDATSPTRPSRSTSTSDAPSDEQTSALRR